MAGPQDPGRFPVFATCPVLVLGTPNLTLKIKHDFPEMT